MISLLCLKTIKREEAWRDCCTLMNVHRVPLNVVYRGLYYFTADILNIHFNLAILLLFYFQLTPWATLVWAQLNWNARKLPRAPGPVLALPALPVSIRSDGNDIL